MNIYMKEIKSAFKAFIIWTAAIVFMIALCIFMFPQMESQIDDVNNMFSNMGGFTDAFGMDQLNFGELIGFYGIECGNILIIGATFFAAFIGISIVSIEEKDHTAEFLLTHPISRSRILTEKLLAVITQIASMNVIVIVVSLSSIAMIDENVVMKEFLLLHLGYFILQLEIAFITFGISAFINRGSAGVGIGFAAFLYFMNIIYNISDSAAILKYITPFAYADASTIIGEGKLDWLLIALGASYSLIAVICGYVKYNKKDITA